MSKAIITRHGDGRMRRAIRVRSKIKRSDPEHRLTVSKSNKYIFAQVVDRAGKAIFGLRAKSATEVGEKVGQAAVMKKVDHVVFDRGQYKYHGKVKQLAEAARAAGLKF